MRCHLVPTLRPAAGEKTTPSPSPSPLSSRAPMPHYRSKMTAATRKTSSLIVIVSIIGISAMLYGVAADSDARNDGIDDSQTDGSNTISGGSLEDNSTDDGVHKSTGNKNIFNRSSCCFVVHFFDSAMHTHDFDGSTTSITASFVDNNVAYTRQLW